MVRLEHDSVTALLLAGACGIRQEEYEGEHTFEKSSISVTNHGEPPNSHHADPQKAIYTVIALMAWNL